MKTLLLLLLSALVAARTIDDPCHLSAYSPPGCAPGSSSNATIDVNQVLSCQQPSIWWDYPCGMLNATYSYGELDFNLCISNVIGGVTKIAYVAYDNPPKPLPLPKSGKLSCLPLWYGEVKLIFTASKEQSFGAFIDYTIQTHTASHPHIRADIGQ